MNIKQAAVKWELGKKVVIKICEYYHLPKSNGNYSIPDNIRPVYIPDKRYLKIRIVFISLHAMLLINNYLLIAV